MDAVTSYCLGESFNFEAITKYVTTSHGLLPVQYDECLYFYYEGVTKERMFGDPSAKLGGYHIPMERSTSMQGSLYANFPHVLESAATQDINPTWAERGEVFVFDYGVVVLWNFTEAEEQSYLGHLRPFAVSRVRTEDMEIEDFHFQYDIGGPAQPRIFNDMITLKSSSPLIKLTISHGLSQSVKLSLFENMMEETIQGAVPLPKMLAQYGIVKMSRTKIMKIIGNLYKLRMNVNLISNVLGMMLHDCLFFSWLIQNLVILDTPEMFWSEPGLEGLYSAIRGKIRMDPYFLCLPMMSLFFRLLGNLTKSVAIKLEGRCTG